MTDVDNMLEKVCASGDWPMSHKNRAAVKLIHVRAERKRTGRFNEYEFARAQEERRFFNEESRNRLTINCNSLCKQLEA
jgi:hypothetical protein